MDKQRDLDPLIEQVQGWWVAQHLNCRQESPDPLGRPFEIFRWSYRDEDLAPTPCPIFCGWQRGRTTDQLTASLRPRVKAGAVRAARLLEDPDANIALQVAEALAPQPFGDELRLVADLIEAAGAQTEQGRNRALVGAGFAAFGLGVLFLGRGRAA